MLVEVDLDSNFLDSVDFINQNRLVIKKHMKYEWKSLSVTIVTYFFHAWWRMKSWN